MTLSLYSCLQVTYTEVLVASLCSLSYAEDDNRHILGIKTTQRATVAGSTLTREEDLLAHQSKGNFCCHVLECDSEVMPEHSYGLVLSSGCYR